MTITSITAPEIDPTVPVEEDLGRIGSLVAGAIVRARTTSAVDDPSTGRFLAACPMSSTDDMAAAFRAARRSQPGWQADEQTRRAVPRALAAVLEDNAEALVRVLCRESGKTLMAAGGEIGAAAAHARWYAEQPLRHEVLADGPSGRVEVHRAPIGVVVAIAPWNAPVLMLVNKIAAALLAGNTVVAKPSPFTPLSSALLARLIVDVVPVGVVNVLFGGDDLGIALTRHDDADMIAFTGSVQAGRAIMAAAAPRLGRLLLELGGNDAAIVLPDVDVAEIAPRLFRGAFGLSGQICAAIKRLYVHEEVFGDVVDALSELAGRAVPGGPFEPGTTFGPLTTRPQRDRVVELVADALAAGGTAVTGGAPLDRPGYFYPPTLVTGVGPGVRLVDEEQFGPALPILPFGDVDAALDAANDSPYGLGGSVWSADVDRATDLALRLRAGGTWVNRHPFVGADVPFGGVRQSGIGREGGMVGIDAFCELKTLSVGPA